ncbi:MAG: carbamoyltransferase HypF [Spirochaetota bacterium]
MPSETSRIIIKGIVQGVGFRPFLYRILSERTINARVYNSVRGVIIETNIPRSDIESLIAVIRERVPPLSYIESIDIEHIPYQVIDDLIIAESEDDGDVEALIPPDSALCSDCARELFYVSHPKYHYPFINCTNCGPRFSIVETVPYDRMNTSMKEFPMCERCEKEYRAIDDRRFHAEPNACSACGPRVTLHDAKGSVIAEESDTAIAEAARLLKEGRIVAIKSIGGFHIAVDPFNDDAVLRLRRMKGRDTKPFALMADSTASAERYCDVNAEASRLLSSTVAPIVLLPRRTDVPEGTRPLSMHVAPRSSAYGIMLPYTPLHRLLFAHGITLLIMTSGNKKDEPIETDNYTMMKTFEGDIDACLVHDRPIVTRVDDSIIRPTAAGTVFMRRSRGFVPAPIPMPTASSREILAMGSDVKNVFAFARGQNAFASQYTGDLSSIANFYQMQRNIEHMTRLFSFAPEVIAVDMHPNYFSSQFGNHLAASLEAPVVPVQHHVAHAASLILERAIEAPAAVFTFDGSGYGTDNSIWGGEVIVFDGTVFTRVLHLPQFTLPGSEMAIRDNNRIAAALLYATFGRDFLSLPIPFVQNGDFDDILFQIEHGINAPRTSSMGRVFDAVAALTGIRDTNTYEGDAAIALEEAAARDERHTLIDGIHTLDFRPLIISIVELIRGNVPPPVIAARFHNSIARTMLDTAMALRDERSITRFGASGGVFQNAFLIERAKELFDAEGLTLFLHRGTAPNDECIALGQIAVAMMEHD